MGPEQNKKRTHTLGTGTKGNAAANKLLAMISHVMSRHPVLLNTRNNFSLQKVCDLVLISSFHVATFARW